MKQEKYLSEIAKIFGIRASALRYWESEGLLKFERNRENNYREPTMQNMLAVYDILFLRSLSIPVDKIRTCFASSLGEISDVFEENEQTLTRRIAELESSLVRLKKKSAAIRRIGELRARGNACVYERLPAFHPFALSEQKSRANSFPNTNGWASAFVRVAKNRSSSSSKKIDLQKKNAI